MVVEVNQGSREWWWHLLQPLWSLSPLHRIACPLVVPKHQTFHQHRFGVHQTCPKYFEGEKSPLQLVIVLHHHLVEHPFIPKSHHALCGNQRTQPQQHRSRKISWLEYMVQNQEGCWNVEGKEWLNVDMVKEHLIAMPYACDIGLGVPNQFVGRYERPTWL